MYRLYYTWKSAAMAPHIALEEIGAPYELELIDFDRPWPEDYLALNPHRKVPTLVDGDGRVFYQSAALLLHLADVHPDSALAPAPGTPERGRCYQWLFFMAEMLQPSYHMHFYPERHVADESLAPSVDAKATEWLADLWGRIDRAIGDGPWFLGDTFSACDAYMTMLAVWNQPHHVSLRGFPAVWATLERARRRVTVGRVLEHNRVQGFR